MKTYLSLRSLDVGQRFYAVSDKRKVKVAFEVLDKCKFNSGHGTSTRNCANKITGLIESKSCNLKVIVCDSNVLAVQ